MRLRAGITIRDGFIAPQEDVAVDGLTIRGDLIDYQALLATLPLTIGAMRKRWERRMRTARDRFTTSVLASDTLAAELAVADLERARGVLDEVRSVELVGAVYLDLGGEG